jgi:hypothetical protein
MTTLAGQVKVIHWTRNNSSTSTSPTTKQPIHYYNRENILKFSLIIDADADANAIDHNLLMMIVSLRSVILGRHTMCQAGAILGTDDHMLVDIGATHNFININFACIIGLMEQRINTSVLHKQAPSIITTLLALSAITQAARQQATPPRSPSLLPLPCCNMSQATRPHHPNTPNDDNHIHEFGSPIDWATISRRRQQHGFEQQLLLRLHQQLHLLTRARANSQTGGHHRCRPCR